MNENDLFIKRMYELAERAYFKGYNTYSDFLNIDEISTLKSIKPKSNYMLYGGYELADRCIACFGDNFELDDFPIICIAITPVQQKFADKLSHRDFLGAIMNLGISRSTIGDIIIENNVGYLFCLSNMAEYIVDSLNRIKHTTVKCIITDSLPDFINKEPESMEITVSSRRADAVIASVFRLSRSQTEQLFNQEKVFVNSKATCKEALSLKDNDTVSVRGYGKFVFSGILRETRKGRSVAEIKIYK